MNRKWISVLTAITLLALTCVSAAGDTVGGTNGQGAPQATVQPNAPDDKSVVIIPGTRFEPNADWYLGFGLFDTSEANVKLKAVRIRDVDVTNAVDTSTLTVKVNVVKGMSKAELQRWAELQTKVDTAAALPQDERDELTNLHRKYTDGTQDTEPQASKIVIVNSKLPFKTENGATYDVQIDLQKDNTVETLATTVTVQALPTDTSWAPADLHLHSTRSDGEKEPIDIKPALTSQGFKIAYFTDHVDKVVGGVGWNQYCTDISALSDSSFAAFAGLEETLLNDAGDLLCYGISSTVGIQNKTYGAVEAITNVYRNNPSGYSSPAIAHPYGIPSWQDWTCQPYSGYELISGSLQIYYDAATAPATRWVSELRRVYSYISDYSKPPFPSARTGSDWHEHAWEPAHPSYVTWINTSNWQSKVSVDNALCAGKTVASAFGSLAYFTLSYSGRTAAIGDILSKVPASSSVSAAITIKPIANGQYTIQIRKDDNTTPLYNSTMQLLANSTTTLLPTFTSESGTHSYFVYISGADWVYTSPIFITN